MMVFRVLTGKDDATRIKEKFAFTCKDRPKGKVVWIHAVSVGESRTALILVDKIVKEFGDVTVLMTSTTLNSAQMLAKEIGDNYYGRVIHQFLPVDSALVVRKFINHWKIDMAFFLESEIWPNFLNEVKKRNISALLISAMFRKEQTFFKWHGKWMQKALLAFEHFLRVLNLFQHIMKLPYHLFRP